MAAQLIFLIMSVFGLGVEVWRHGEIKEIERYDINRHLVLISIGHGLLYWGGFYDVFFK